jgi:hypothetical protein
VPTAEAELALRVAPAAGGGARPAASTASTACWLRRAEREGENSGVGIAEEGMASAPRSRYMANEVGGLASKDSEEGK